MVKRISIILTALLLVAAQCGPPPTMPERESNMIKTDVLINSRESPFDGPQVRRVVDEEAGVVCWVTQGDIDCLPIEQTKLKK